MNITDKAREAAEREINNWKQGGIVSGHHVQLAINEAVRPLVEAMHREPHYSRCNLNKPLPFSDEAREEYYKLKCDCWKAVLSRYTQSTNGLNNEPST